MSEKLCQLLIGSVVVLYWGDKVEYSYHSLYINYSYEYQYIIGSSLDVYFIFVISILISVIVDENLE